MNWTETIFKFGDWIQNKLSTKTGIFVIGMLVGVFPTASLSYILYRDNKTKVAQIQKLEEKVITVEQERNKWQDRTIDSENRCLEKVRDMMIVFKDLEKLYTKGSENVEHNLTKEERTLKEYENIVNKLDNLKDN